LCLLKFKSATCKVAFLDEAPGGRQYSVFIRGTGAPPEGLESQTVEIYRWGLLNHQPLHAGRTNEHPPVLRAVTRPHVRRRGPWIERSAARLDDHYAAWWVTGVVSSCADHTCGEVLPTKGFMSSGPKHPTPMRRVRLPANPESKRGVVLGEGKPENQNHAIIFCHNEALQSIDMNQV